MADEKGMETKEPEAPREGTAAEGRPSGEGTAPVEAGWGGAPMAAAARGGR